jgi:acyl-CoA synthetase (AMP-forming)/AMP-acid ligase II
VNVAQLLTEPARERSQHPALLFEERTFTYAELDQLTSRFANLLTTLHIGQGGVLAIFLESSPELLISVLGSLKAGAVPNVVNAMLRPEEVRHVVSESGALLLVTDADRWQALAPVRDGLGVRHALVTGGRPDADARSFEDALAQAPNDFAVLALPPDTLACLLYTSGTTGLAKGVMLSHRNIFDNATQFARVHYEADECLLIAAPLFHCWGLINGALGILAVGGTAIAVRRFRTEPLLDLIEAARPTQLMAVPTMINYLLKSPTLAGRDLRSLRTVHCAAAPMPLELIEVLRRDWEIGYAESYGLTETSPVITTTTPAEMRPGSCGRAMGDTELKVVNRAGNTLPTGAVGELWARGTAISAGYYHRPEATAEVFLPGGWFRTGDVVRMDEDGYVFIVDRAKDMINVGGEKVYPREVEEVLHRNPAVADAVVVGVPDPDLGEVVKAYVALKPDHTCNAEELIRFLRSALAPFKLPRRVEFVASIPRSPSGKALRRLLR